MVKIWHILTLSFVVGTAQSFGGPAYSALIPTLVKTEDLPNAIALNSIQFNVARVLGPSCRRCRAGALGASWCFGLNGISFIAVIISLLIIHPHFVPTKSRESVLTSMKEGFHFIRNQGTMEALIVLAFMMTLLAFPLIVFLPVFAKDVFHGGPSLYTVFLVCSGIGSICGALTVAALGKHKHMGLLVLLMLLGLGVLISGFALSRTFRSELRSHFHLGSDASGRFHQHQLAGSVDRARQHARPGDQRLQRRLSRRACRWEAWWLGRW